MDIMSAENGGLYDLVATALFYHPGGSVVPLRQ